jgi:ankyrin repeat protein
VYSDDPTRRLYEAVDELDEATVREALLAGADINAIVHGKTPLLRASQTGDLAICFALLEGGADPNLPVCTGKMPLCWAHCPDLVRLLLRYGASVKCELTTGAATSLHSAARNGESDRLALLLGADGKEAINSLAHYDDTPLALAAAHGHVSAVKLLVEAGADLDLAYTETAKPTPLQYALYDGHLETARVLLEAGADPNISWGMTIPPAILAKQAGIFEQLRSYLPDLPSHEMTDAVVLRARAPGQPPFSVEASSSGNFGPHAALRKIPACRLPQAEDVADLLEALRFSGTMTRARAGTFPWMR